MKLNPKIKIIILTTLGILFASSPIITTNLSFITGHHIKSSECSDDIILDNKNLKISAVSGKIHIINNSGWVDFRNAGNCTGNGTYSEPYIIENLVIDGGDSGSCIWIENSNVYFKIENCTVYNSVGIWNDAGIRLLNVTHSQLINNTCSSNSNGILLYECFNNSISGNTARNNINYGIYILISNYTTVFGNTAPNNFYAGIRLFASYNTNITGNTANNNKYDGIHLARSHNNTISGNNANDNECGIFFYNSTYNTISGNTANNNSYGIYLASSNDNIVSGNTLIGNDECIVEGNCLGNTFSDNGDCTYGQGDGGQPIPGYNLFFLLGILSVVVILVSKKLKKS